MPDRYKSMVTFPKPDNGLLHEYIIESNALDGSPVTHTEIEVTLQRKQIHPYVAGHLSGFKYAIESLAKNHKWPGNHPIQWENDRASDTNLHWLRELHKKLMKPVSTYGESLKVMSYIQAADCGNYRLHPHCVGLDRWQPKASAVPRLLHHWHKDLGAFHLKMANKLSRPSFDDIELLADQAYQSHLQLVAIAPFQSGNGRLARLIENALRLRWGLPWKTIKKVNSLAYIKDIAQLEDSPTWRQHLKDLNAREGT